MGVMTSMNGGGLATNVCKHARLGGPVEVDLILF